MVSGCPAVIGFSRSRTCTCTSEVRSAVTVRCTGVPTGTSTLVGAGVTVAPFTVIARFVPAGLTVPAADALEDVPDEVEDDAGEVALEAVPPQPARVRPATTSAEPA